MEYIKLKPNQTKMESYQKGIRPKWNKTKKESDLAWPLLGGILKSLIESYLGILTLPAENTLTILRFSD